MFKAKGDRMVRKKVYKSAKAWLPQDLDNHVIFFNLSASSKDDVMRYVKGLTGSRPIEQIRFDGNRLSSFSKDIEACRDKVDLGVGLVVIKPIPEVTVEEQRRVAWAVSNFLGTPLIQNSEGNRLIHVYDRDRTRRMENGARYHQTRQGGSIHTDNVNIPEIWEYLVLSCVCPAMSGGETILVSGLSVFNYLLEHSPQALEILTQPFWWEYRGISDDLYQAPIITFDENEEPLFRYLRDYLVSAHEKAQQPLRDDQLWALDVLDSILECTKLQLRYNLGAGEILVTKDSQILHGRTSFADYFSSSTIEDCNNNGNLKLRRTMDRAWVKAIRGKSLS